MRREMLEFKRPANGINPKEIDNIVGKKTKRNIQKDKLILKDDIE